MNYSILCYLFLALPTLAFHITKTLYVKPKLQMTCDFFVSKSLRIYYTHYPFYSVIEIFTECCKYNENNVKPNLLLPRPILIYTNNSFTSQNLEKKYSKIIQEKLLNDTLTFHNVTKILKLEIILDK